MLSLTPTNNTAFKTNEVNERKTNLLSKKNNIHLVKPKHSLKKSYDSINEQFIKGFNSEKFKSSTRNEFYPINPSLKNLPLINNPTMLSRQNKNISFIDFQENNIKKLSLSLERETGNNKDIIYNFGYDKKNRIETLDLKLHKDSIEEQEKEYLRRKEEEVNKKKKEIYLQLNNNVINQNNNVINKKEKKKENNLQLKNFEDKLIFDKVDNELNITLRQMNLLNNEANLAYKKYKLESNKNMLNLYNNNPNIPLNKNKFKIRKVKIVALSPIAKNGFNILGNFCSKNKNNV